MYEIKVRRYAGILAAVLALAACGTTPTATSPPSTTTPKQAVFALQGAYKTALIPIATYVELPRCTASKPPCSDSARVAQLQKAVRVAELAVDAADSAVYSPGFGTSAIQTAVAAAQAAMQALAAISPTGAQ